MDLALEDLDLAPKCQHLSLEQSLITVTGRNHVEQRPEAANRREKPAPRRKNPSWPG